MEQSPGLAALSRRRAHRAPYPRSRLIAKGKKPKMSRRIFDAGTRL
jgi:hypothetical protein